MRFRALSRSDYSREPPRSEDDRPCNSDRALPCGTSHRRPPRGRRFLSGIPSRGLARRAMLPSSPPQATPERTTFRCTAFLGSVRVEWRVLPSSRSRRRARRERRPGGVFPLRPRSSTRFALPFPFQPSPPASSQRKHGRGRVSSSATVADSIRLALPSQHSAPAPSQRTAAEGPIFFPPRRRSLDSPCPMASVAGRAPRARSPAAEPPACSSASWSASPVRSHTRVGSGRQRRPDRRRPVQARTAPRVEARSRPANTTIGPKLGPSRPASDQICAQDSNGRCSRQRGPGFGTPRLAGLSSSSFQATHDPTPAAAPASPRSGAPPEP
jgi:hypothetical protein